MKTPRGKGMNILAVDPGTKCGWAALYGGRVESGTQEFPVGRGDAPGMRYLRFRRWIGELLDTIRPDLTIYELPFMRGGYATEFLSGLTTRIQEECSARNVLYQAVNPATLKKASTGRGTASKADMIGAANEYWRARLHRSVTDDNEADALNLLAMAVRENGGEP